VTFKSAQSSIGEIGKRKKKKKHHEIAIYFWPCTIHPCSYLSICADRFGRLEKQSSNSTYSVTGQTGGELPVSSVTESQRQTGN